MAIQIIISEIDIFSVIRYAKRGFCYSFFCSDGLAGLLVLFIRWSNVFIIFFFQNVENELHNVTITRNEKCL